MRVVVARVGIVAIPMHHPAVGPAQPHRPAAPKQMRRRRRRRAHVSPGARRVVMVRGRGSVVVGGRGVVVGVVGVVGVQPAGAAVAMEARQQPAEPARAAVPAAVAVEGHGADVRAQIHVGEALGDLGEDPAAARRVAHGMEVGADGFDELEPPRVRGD